MKVKAKDILHNCIYSESLNNNFTIGNFYHVLGVEDEYYRLLDDNLSPVLIEKKLFENKEHIPSNWIKKIDDDEVSIYPIELSEQFFFEDFFNKDPEKVAIFNDYLKRILNN